jgi:hypothetical protein
MGLRGIATDVTAAGNSPFGRLFAGEDRAPAVARTGATHAVGRFNLGDSSLIVTRRHWASTRPRCGLLRRSDGPAGMRTTAMLGTLPLLTDGVGGGMLRASLRRGSGCEGATADRARMSGQREANGRPALRLMHCEAR